MATPDRKFHMRKTSSNTSLNTSLKLKSAEKVYNKFDENIKDSHYLRDYEKVNDKYSGLKLFDGAKDPSSSKRTKKGPGSIPPEGYWTKCLESSEKSKTLQFNHTVTADPKVIVAPDLKPLEDHLDKREPHPEGEATDENGTWLMTRYIERVKEFDIVDKIKKKEEN